MKSVKTPLILILICYMPFVKEIKAQESTFSSFYFFNSQLYNPSFSGLNGTRITATHRSLWLSLPGSPKYNSLMADGSFDGNAGWGAVVTDEKYGFFKVNSLSGSFSYSLALSHESSLNMGFSGFFRNTAILFNDVIARNPDDPILLNGELRGSSLDIGAGIMYQFRDLQIGLAIPHALAPKAKFNSKDAPARMAFDRKLNAMAFYSIKTNNEKFSIKPSVMALYDESSSPVLLDGTIMADYQGAGWAGVFVRNNAIMGLNLGLVAFEKISMGYSFGFYTGKLRSYSGFNHEFMASYKINERKPVSPRTKGMKEAKAPKDPLEKIKDINELKRIIKYKEDQIIRKIDEFYTGEAKDKEKAKAEIAVIELEIEEYKKQVEKHLDRLQKEK